MAQLLYPLQGLAQKFDTAILLVAHFGKSSYDDVLDNFRGSSALGGAFTMGLGLTRRENHLILQTKGRRVAGESLRLGFDFQSQTWFVLGDDDKLREDEEYDEIEDVVREKVKVSAPVVARELGIDPKTARKKLQRMVSSQRLWSNHEKDGKQWTTYYSMRA